MKSYYVKLNTGENDFLKLTAFKNIINKYYFLEVHPIIKVNKLIKIIYIILNFFFQFHTYTQT